MGKKQNQAEINSELYKESSQISPTTKIARIHLRDVNRNYCLLFLLSARSKCTDWFLLY